jgi:hypothetical protein
MSHTNHFEEKTAQTNECNKTGHKPFNYLKPFIIFRSSQEIILLLFRHSFPARDSRVSEVCCVAHPKDVIQRQPMLT